uniref:Ionotropic glutamate receptor C-terminal domain-containing protein n=1 Tax=Anopheles epiroticus TaxID=199890 RepID=A0A182PIE3_9DIPT
MPSQYRWCLAVPKTYNRILHQQVFEPYATDLWVMIAIIACGYLLYNLCLKDALQRRHPNAFPIVNTPLHILRILLLFLLTEYYTALLSSNLGLSLMPSYPKTLGQFQKSTIPLITKRPDLYHFLLSNPDLLARTITWNLSKRYDPTGLALILLCDLFPYTISQTSQLLSKELSRHHYHMINEPVQSIISVSPFLRTSPLLPRFQLYVDRLYEAGIWDYVVRKWTLGAMHPTTSGNNALDLSILTLEHFLPVFIVGGYLYLLAIGIFLLEVIIYRILRSLNVR